MMNRPSSVRFFGLALTALLAQNAFADLHCGESVVETYDSARTILQVVAIAANGDVVLSNGVTYSGSYVQELLPSYNGIDLHQNVVETYDSSRSTLQVNAISADGDFLLSDGTWYNTQYVQKLQGNFNGISVGDQVCETFDSVRGLYTVQEISADGDYLLSNGTWYNAQYIQRLVPSSNNIWVGDRAVETFDSSRSTLRVKAISADGDFLLENGTWYNTQYIQPILREYNGIRVGDDVLETYDSAPQMLEVTEIAGDGDYLLANGTWYNSQYIQKLTCGDQQADCHHHHDHDHDFDHQHDWHPNN